MVVFKLTATLCIVLYAAPVIAQTEDDLLKIRAEGFAPGTGIAARERAEAAARRDALALGLQMLLKSDDLTIAAPILERGEDYVQSSRRLDSGSTDGGTRVFVEVYFDNEKLRLDAATVLFPRLQTPARVIFLIAERVLGSPDDSLRAPGRVESTFVESFRKAAFEVVDGNGYREAYTTPELMLRLNGDAASAGRFGRENRATIVVLGEAVSSLQTVETQGNLQKVVAKVDCRVIRAADGELVATVASEAAVHSAEPAQGAIAALNDAALKVQQRLMVAAILGLAGQTADSEFSLAIQHPLDAAHVEGIVARLREEPGIGDVELLRTGVDLALIRFGYNGKVGALVKRLETPGEAGYGLETVSVVGRDMVFRMR